MSSKKHILIIGGSSFVAKNFIRLQQDNYIIQIVSRTTTGYENEILLQSFINIPSEIFKNIDVVINCAAIVHQPSKVANELYNEINFTLPIDIALKAKSEGVTTFVQLSTIAVYGKHEHIDINTKETPINSYGKSKLLADQQLSLMIGDRFKVVILRPPMIYGKEGAPGNMIRLIKFILKGFPLPLKKLINKRDFIHIDNLIGFMNSAICENASGIFLVSDNSPVLIGELYQTIITALKKTNRAFWMPKIAFVLMKNIIPGIYDKIFGSLTIDIKPTLKKLSYQPKNIFNEGIIEMVNSLNNSK